MNIATRVRALVVAGVAALAILCALNGLQTHRVYEATNFANAITLPKSKVLTRVLQGLANTRIRMYRYCLTPTAAGRAEILPVYRQGRVEFEQAISEYAPLVSDAEDARLYATIQDLAPRVLQEQAGYLKAVDEGGKVDLMALLANERTTPLKLHATIQDAVDYNVKLGEGAADAALAAKHLATWVDLGILVVAIAAFVWQGHATTSSLTRKLANANRVAEKVANGDLQPEPHRGGAVTDEIDRLLVTLDRMRTQLAGTLSEIVQVADGVRASADTLSAASEETANLSHRGSQISAESAAALEQLTVSIEEISRSASAAHARADESQSLAQASAVAVEASETTVADVAHRVEFTASKVGTLANDIQEITAITTVIREMAEQTNLLALNAAIEAARAGEQGRGFAVVADEVRKLAERTATSVHSITTVISRIRDSSTEVVDSMGSAHAMVNTALDSARTSAAGMQTIAEASRSLQASIAAISAALGEQRAASGDVTQNVESMAEISERNAGSAGSVSEAAQGLKLAAERLHGKLATFRI